MEEEWMIHHGSGERQDFVQRQGTPHDEKKKKQVEAVMLSFHTRPWRAWKLHHGAGPRAWKRRSRLGAKGS